MLIDIHTHKNKNFDTELAIQNVSSHFENSYTKGCYSMGLHPWYLSDSVERDYIQLCNGVLSDNVVAIGEIGLDKICRVDFNLQINYFQKQIELANEVKKPIIIHCVKAFEEVLSILFQSKPDVPVIFHGFNKKLELANRILKAGHYLSFGKVLLQQEYVDIFQSIPIDKFFLETDNADRSIKEIYDIASSIKGIHISDLEKAMSINANKVFGDKFVFL